MKIEQSACIINSCIFSQTQCKYGGISDTFQLNVTSVLNSARIQSVKACLSGRGSMRARALYRTVPRCTPLYPTVPRMQLLLQVQVQCHTVRCQSSG